MLCLYDLNQSSRQVTSRRSKHSDLSWNLKNSYDTEQAHTEHMLSKDSSSSSDFDSIFKSTSIASTNSLDESDFHWSIHQALAECISLSSSQASTSQDTRQQRNWLSIKMIKTQVHAEHMTSMHQRIEQENEKERSFKWRRSWQNYRSKIQSLNLNFSN